MNKITREQIITEILDILTEIKLENLGLPKDIVEFIRSIPTEEVKNKLEPIQLENYIGWIGQILKSDSGIFAYYDIDSDQIQEAYKKIRKFVIYWPSKNIDFFPDDIFDNVVNEIFNILIPILKNVFNKSGSDFLLRHIHVNSFRFLKKT